MVKFIKTNWQKIVAVFYAFLLPSVSLAQNTNCDPATSGKICNPIPSISSIPNFIQTILEGALKLGIPVVALAVIYCGFLFVAARGNSEKLSQAKTALMYTLIGAGILLGSWAIAELISNTVLSL